MVPRRSRRPLRWYVLGDLYRKSEGDRLLDDTARKIAEGAPVSGWPTLVERIGRERASKVSAWLQIMRGDGDDDLLRGRMTIQRAPALNPSPPAKRKAAPLPPIPVFYTEAELAGLVLPIPQYVIHELLTVGLYILAASPKLGKTWMNFGAGRAVATGTLFGGSRMVRQGPVLFLDLEGNQRRAQKRSAMLRAGAPASADFHIIHAWPPMLAGGLELLERAIVEKKAVLAMIDVWACFRPPRAKNADPYQHDHESAKLVQEMAHRTNCAIVITHHNRKAEADDWTAQVSGTAGLTGAADGIITLSREARQRRRRHEGHRPRYRRARAGPELQGWRVGDPRRCGRGADEQDAASDSLRALLRRQADEAGGGGRSRWAEARSGAANPDPDAARRHRQGRHQRTLCPGRTRTDAMRRFLQGGVTGVTAVAEVTRARLRRPALRGLAWCFADSAL